LIGLIVLLGITGSVGFFAALMAAAALTVFIGLVATRLICTGEEDSVGDSAGGATGGVSGAAAGVASAASNAGSAVAEKASDTASATAEAAQSAASTASNTAKEAADKAKAATDTAKAEAKEAAEEAKETAESAVDAAESTVKSGAAAGVTGGVAATPDYDGDGKHEGANEGSKPETLSAPKGGAADNLKEIKGVGPKLESMLNDMGFYHFDQIAQWGPDEVAWVDSNIKGFKGRVSRDNWVEQARTLASGGETEFSKRARDGDVY
jgi:predicted flap endonuclease-1-like 5' DNA nuclease